MKSLNIKLGGHHLLGDDLLFLQSSLAEGLLAFINSFVGDYTILSGVEYTNAGGTLSWTAGWIFLQGELCQVDAGSTPVSGSTSWQIVESYDALGDQTYEDLNVEHTYVVRKAAPTASAGGAYLWTVAKRLENWRSWQGLAFSGAWTSNAEALLYTKTLGCDVIFRGGVKVTSYNTGTDPVIFTLPTLYRPQEKRTILAPGTIGGTRTFIFLEINTDGTVCPLGLASTNNVVIHLDGIRYIIR